MAVLSAPSSSPKISCLQQEVLAALETMGKPASLDGITRHVTLTRHPSRIRLALQGLEKHGMAQLTEYGWIRRLACPAS